MLYLAIKREKGGKDSLIPAKTKVQVYLRTRMLILRISNYKVAKPFSFHDYILKRSENQDFKIRNSRSLP